MDPYERSKIGDALYELKYNKGDYVIREGESGDKFYIILDGTAMATKQLNGPEPEKVFDYVKG